MKKISLVVFPALTIVLEALPLGAVCTFAPSPTERVRETFSYLALYRLDMQILLHLLQPYLLLLSCLLYTSRQTISNWENEKSYPDIISVIKMSDCYEVSLDYLLKGEQTMKTYYAVSYTHLDGRQSRYKTAC